MPDLRKSRKEAMKPDFISGCFSSTSLIFASIFSRVRLESRLLWSVPDMASPDEAPRPSPALGTDSLIWICRQEGVRARESGNSAPTLLKILNSQTSSLQNPRIHLKPRDPSSQCHNDRTHNSLTSPCLHSPGGQVSRPSSHKEISEPPLLVL